MLRSHIILILVLGLLLPMASCDNNNKGSDKEKALNDSVSALVGKEGAGECEMLIKQIPPGRFKLDRAAYLEGFAQILLCDTLDHDQSYMLGVSQAIQMYGQLMQWEDQYGIRFNKTLLLKEFRKAFIAKKPVSQDELQRLSSQIQLYFRQATQQVVKKKAELGKTYLVEGQNYIARQVRNAGYTKAPSGIAYKVLRAGKGDRFMAGDYVHISYKGMHTDGTVFDQSQKGEIVQITDLDFIEGFVEALKMLRPGARLSVIIPGNLAYGMEGDDESGIKPGEAATIRRLSIIRTNDNEQSYHPGHRSPCSRSHKQLQAQVQHKRPRRHRSPRAIPRAVDRTKRGQGLHRPATQGRHRPEADGQRAGLQNHGPGQRRAI